jgi:hypothetical protein
MKILEKELTHKGFNYKQLYRDGKFAVYEQSKDGYKFKKYEAIVIESHNGYEIAGVYCPPSEMYPNASQWGDKGFTLDTYEEAMDKINYMKKHRKEKVK